MDGPRVIGVDAWAERRSRRSRSTASASSSAAASRPRSASSTGRWPSTSTQPSRNSPGR